MSARRFGAEASALPGGVEAASAFGLTSNKWVRWSDLQMWGLLLLEVLGW